ncbi:MULTISPECIES: GNAT family N-acetyltransferase [Brucella/Ochrobactrum group]|uniref:GCN5-related N-acetyltransferase n=1 Tax=Brucella anthropi (strain ATCC 49188 / DSM 6882 / CCUG 24695 / JCM 21032 / LMG 3331 / NBRC 15819 / NCTC 12168 / Alc 37) TaxID=439375 RepID=A6X0M4_BRUA4|nr:MULTISPECIES: GNAT family N-acetyltransferase [Brucella/Ochrobactrum group]ABS14778.1 GCN5-related N-acetyltransferase [Brucella anthropi ATCC 49188]AIK45279.1 acetyltransferase family protein [Brucella anthropi]KAB2739115.1 GNAT family N-acetyltransferase [Brucella anthropi]KAB2751635.1 GNAT family N-acetyltransferase [Brucella anthropi]KAB2753774.1 GNAT family N-acetyltransferase [Brucella anthropi]
MAGQPNLRPAERREAAEIAILVDISSHGFASWLWYGAVLDGRTETAMERGRQYMRADGSEGWQSVTIAEWAGDIAGLSIGFTVDESINDLPEKHPVTDQLIAMQRKVIGNRFIDSVGVYREFRGKGIGRALVANEIDLAYRNGNPAISLITESHNDVALSLYGAHGFKEIERLEAIERIGQDKRHDWVLLTREVN